jgi:hypothetical protein
VAAQVARPRGRGHDAKAVSRGTLPGTLLSQSKNARGSENAWNLDSIAG